MKHVILGLVLLVLVGGIVLLAVGSWAVSVNNGLARSEQNVNEKWAQVQTVYQRRLDLIPGLEESVKGFARQERTVLTEVTRRDRARAAFSSRPRRSTTRRPWSASRPRRPSSAVRSAGSW